MRLLQLDDNGGLSLVERLRDDIPRYAILSHTWGKDEEEVTFQDFTNDRGKSKLGYRKLQFCAIQAARDGLKHFWIDTCCIDKSSSSELSEAINSMFRWYRVAEKCYVYLSDVSYSDGDDRSQRWKPAFRKSRWFTRGWTLQELIAPTRVEFFSNEGTYLSNRESMQQTIHEITGIAINALGGKSLSKFSRREKYGWAERRKTKREEDEIYCLLGIFDVHLPHIYGEQRKGALSRLEEQIEKTSRGASSALIGEELKRELLESLRFEQIDARHANIKNANTRTCKWLLHKSEYLDWLDTTKLSEHHGFLWIKGKPGTGKSTLMKFVSANARKKMKDWVVISFFFNARGESIEKSTIGTYRSLLLQLLERLPALQSVFGTLGLSTLSANTEHQWSIESLKTLLEYAIQDLGESSVICFIDALDECEEDQIRDMVSFFERMGDLATSSKIRFQVCFSSRHYPHITIGKGLGLVLEGQEGHTQDIANYLETELKIGNSPIAQQVRGEVQQKASGVFMWVVLVKGILNKEHDRGRMHALRRRLDDIPRDLHELFHDILTRDMHNRDEHMLCIQWVLFAKQPLSPEQLYFAILSGGGPDAVSIWDPEETTRDVIKRFILNSSKGLAEITKSKLPRVQFIHESVRDFLLKEGGLSNTWPDLGTNLQGQSHERLKQCCLNYISVDLFTPLEIPEDLPKASSPEAANLRKSATDAFPLLEYAVHHILYHADAAEGNGIPQTQFVDSFQLPPWVRLNNLLERHEVRRHSESVSLLYILGEYNMPNLIGVHLSTTVAASCLEVGNERYGPPIFAAVATGSKDAVRMFSNILMANHPNESHQSEVNGQNCYEELSETKIGRDFKFLKGRGVLSYSVQFGFTRIVALLLRTGTVDLNAKDSTGRTPLLWAVQNKVETVVKLLLETGQVDVNGKDNRRRTPLSWAVEHGSEAVAKLLLETDEVYVNAKDANGLTPLWWAVKNKVETVVKLLLETGQVNVNSKDNSGNTPLLWAIEHGSESIAELLLETGMVKVNAKDNNGQVRLPTAAVEDYFSGDIEAVANLLFGTD